MKVSLIRIFALFLLMAALCITASAKIEDMPKDWVGEDEFTVVSIHTTSALVDGLKDTESLEDLMYWIEDHKETYNIKYVSFLDDLIGSTTVSSLDLTTALEELQKDTALLKQVETLADIASILTDAGISYGLSYGPSDYLRNGLFRENAFTDFFSIDNMINEEMDLQEYTSENFAVSFFVGDVPYMIVQLELWPRAATVDWFNTLMKDNPDKRTIVYTSSFLDKKGEMYTLWDWSKVSGIYVPSYSKDYNTDVDGFNLGNLDHPLDGDALWDQAFKNYDNIMAVISAHALTDNDIKIKTLTNPNGYQTAALVANSSSTLNPAHGAVAVFTKFSNDGEITAMWSVPYEGYIKESVVSANLKMGKLAEPDLSDTLPKIVPQYNGANKQYILGYEGNTFRPNANMTRAEACTIFARLILGTNDIPTTYTTRFTDVKKTDWFYGAVSFLDESGFFDRLTSTTYKPNEPITRAEFVDLANSASSLGEGNSKISFVDVPEDHFYYKSIIAAAGAGIVNGYEDSTFRPNNTITRAEVVTVVNRLLNLKVSDELIVPEKLENTFVDIKGHWAANNILMASNTEVHSDKYYEADFDGITESATAYTVTTDNYKLEINKKSGKVTSFVNLYTDKNILSNNKDPHFIYLLSKSGAKIAPTGLETVGNRIRATFKNGAEVYFYIDVDGKFATVEIDSQLPTSLGKAIVFGNVIIGGVASWDKDDGYRLATWSMHYGVDPNASATEGGNASSGTVYGHLGDGAIGAKIAMVFDKQSEFIATLREASLATDTSVGLATDLGGPFGAISESNNRDYIMDTVNVTTDLNRLIEGCKTYGIGQIDMHKGGKNFSQGDFRFYAGEEKTVSAKEFYEKAGRKMDEADIELGLHTYAYYLDYNAHEILSDPKWQQQLEFMPDEYTLQRDITARRQNLPTEEDASGFDTAVSFFYKNSRYVLVDEEIILIGTGTNVGFINVDRGQCGTTAAAHSKGAKIRHISGYFTCIAPQIDSELFYHIADKTAEAYLDGGFDFIYIDAIDGIGRHLSDDQAEYAWYYMNKFVNRIISKVGRDVQIEFSSSTEQFYQVRGRGGALDTINRGINYYVDAHVKSGINSKKAGQAYTLGWFAFYNSGTSGLYNTIGKALMRDDIDNMGYQAVIYDLTMVYNPTPIGSAENNPMLHYNASYYNKFYSELRKSHYFTEETKQKVIENGNEFRIIEKAPGEYAFLEMYYQKGNVGNLVGSELSVKGTNPFSEQMPYIRLEKRYSTELENGILLADFDETKNLGEQPLSKTVKVDMTNNMVMSFEVTGTGKDGDAMLITIQSGMVSGESGGIINHLVELNFEGTRRVVIVDSDNGDYDYGKYSFSQNQWTYSHIRTIPGYSNINSVSIQTCGATGGNAKITDIMAYPQSEAPLKNPTLTVGSSSVTFNTTLKGGEYIEYDPVTGKCQVFHADQTISDITFTGKLNVPKGNYTCTLSGEAETSAQTRARIVLGFTGIEITN